MLDAAKLEQIILCLLKKADNIPSGHVMKREINRVFAQLKEELNAKECR